MPEVKLKSGDIIEVRKLRPFELDVVGFEDPGPFRVRVLTSSGLMKEWDYDLTQPPPDKPTVPEHECEDGSTTAQLWEVYNRYQEAWTWHRERMEKIQEYARQVARYVLKECVDSDYSLDDVPNILKAALLPELREEDIEAALASTFPGELLWAESFTGDDWLEYSKRHQTFDRSQVGSADKAGLADQA